MSFKKLLLSGVATSALIFSTGNAVAEPVELTVKETGMVIKGELLSSDNGILEIKLPFGRLKAPIDTVICKGAACPSLERNMNMTVAVADDVSAGIIDAMANGLASKFELEVVPQSETSGGEISFAFRNFDGAEKGVLKMVPMPQQAALEALAKGSVNAVMSNMALPAALSDKIKDNYNLDLTDPQNVDIVALDAFVPAVNPSNRLNALTVEELLLIAGGRLKNWSELGGPDAPIRLILPPDGDADVEYLRETLLTPNRVRLSRRIERMNSAKDIQEAVAIDPHAITFGSRSNTFELKNLPIERVCGLLAYTTEFDVKAEEYPFTRRIQLYSSDASQTVGSEELVNFAKNINNENVLSFAGAFGQSIELTTVNLQGARMMAALMEDGSDATLETLRDFAGELSSAARLSTAFRFLSGSSQLDAKAEQDIGVVANLLSSPEFSQREILVIGFTDSFGRPDLNKRLSLLRAENVRDQIMARAGNSIDKDRIKAMSYGPLAPVGCNSTAEGRASNRRVEIWIR